MNFACIDIVDLGRLAPGMGWCWSAMRFDRRPHAPLNFEWRCAQCKAKAQVAWSPWLWLHGPQPCSPVICMATRWSQPVPGVISSIMVRGLPICEGCRGNCRLVMPASVSWQVVCEPRHSPHHTNFPPLGRWGRVLLAGSHRSQ